MNTTKSTTTSKLICYPEIPYLEIRLTTKSERIYEAHAHPTLSLGVMLEGQTLFRTSKGEFLLQKGGLAIIEPYMQHACNPYKEEKRSYFMVYIDASFCAKLQHTFFQNETETLLPLSSSLIYHKALFEDFLEVITALSKGYSPLHVKVLETWLEQFLWLYTKRAQVKNLDDDLAKVVHFLENRMDESISLAELSNRFNVNPFVLSRHFKKAFGCTPKHYWLDMRIHHAKKLLQEGISISLCAQYCGFVDQSHFHRFFKRRTALTPKEYQVNFIQ